MILLEGKNTHLAKRCFANIIDYSLVFFLMGLTMYALGEPTDSGGYSLTGIKAFIIPVIWFIYFPVCESLARQTPGKKAFDLYVVDLKGEASSIMQTFLRRLLDPIELVLLGVPSLLAINHSDKNQRIGDMMAGTRVVHTQASCKFCQADLELNTREVITKAFQCPRCNAIN